MPFCDIDRWTRTDEMYDRILLPLDGSELAEAIEPHALAMAKKFESEVILLRVVTPASMLEAATIPGRVIPGTMSPISVEAARTKLEAEMSDGVQYLITVAQRFETEGVSTRTHVTEGEPAKTILAYAKEADVAMICMSTHGRSGLGRTIFGSTADEVLRSSHLPLLLIRPQPE